MSTPQKQTTPQPGSVDAKKQQTPPLELKMRCFEVIAKFMPSSNLDLMESNAQHIYQWLLRGEKL